MSSGILVLSASCASARIFNKMSCKETLFFEHRRALSLHAAASQSQVFSAARIIIGKECSHLNRLQASANFALAKFNSALSW
jgi:hypothetical protein